MTDSQSLSDRYLALIDQIVDTTLKGNIRSKEQVYQMLIQGISTGTGEIFERCLDDRLGTTQSQLDNQKDELKKAKANRIFRALQTIQGEWQHWQKDNIAAGAIATAVQQILTAQGSDRLTAFLRVLDPNQTHPFTLEQLQQLAKTLHSHLLQTANPNVEEDLQQLLAGIAKGLESWQRLESDLVSWIYERRQLGFEGLPGQSGPWALWAKKVNSAFPQALFNAISQNQSIAELINRQAATLANLVELAIILPLLQRGLVAWFDKLVYDSKVGAKLSISTFLTFAAIWSQLANGFNHAASLNSSHRDRLANGCFQITLQILRAFSVREYFPLYGGIYASFSGSYLQNTLEYLNEPLRRVEGSQEKARILTLLGYSQRVIGQYDSAISFHEQALEIARNAGDRQSEIANLNHLSRTYQAQKNYPEAINYSQRALMLSRQAGDRQGEANALANYGFSEVFQAKEQMLAEPEVYESAINYLQQGLELSQKQGDRQSQALCFSSLGIACVLLDRSQEALQFLAKGLEAAQFSGDLYLQGLNFAYIAQAYYSVSILQKAVCYGCLGMYMLEQIGAGEWRQPAGLIAILLGQWGEEAFQTALKQERSQIISFIGVDGYDYLPELLEKYQRFLE